MPPDSTHVDEEGVLLDNVQLVAQGRFLDDEMRAILGSGRYPSRNIGQNLADLRAQVAACAKGIDELKRMVAHFGLTVVRAYMQHVQDNAEEAVRRVLDVLTDGHFEYEMDSGAKIAVTISIDKAGRKAVIDFTGTSAQQPTNFNAPSAVCKAAVLYVFRTLVDDEIPMNAGCLKPLDIVIPEGSMLAPRYPAAVVAGNVETSQAITDTLYGALGVLAAAQGTMNNFTFGNDTYQYYETISGGSGAGPDFDGESVVQTHMTNSRLTDPEVLEWRFPVRLDEFRIRPRQRWRRGAPRRRRRRAPRALPRTDDRGHARQPQAGAAVRAGRRQRGRAGTELGRAQRRRRRGIRRDLPGRNAHRRRVRRPDAGRRRLRRAAGSDRPGGRSQAGCRQRIIALSIFQETPMTGVYDFSMTDIHGKPQSLGQYKDKVLLIVNTASQCGFTPQYKGLETLYKKMHARGLEVLGFPCNQFGAQEPGGEEEIESFCEVNYGVTFPMFAKIDVNGKNAAPLYEYLKKAKPGLAGLGGDQVELHQVPGRPQGQGRRALCPEGRARGDRRRHRKAALACPRSRRTGAAPRGRSRCCFPRRSQRRSRRRTPRIPPRFCAWRFRSPKPASTRRPRATPIRTMSTASIFDPLYKYDYLARPFKLVPNTAAALPEISADRLDLDDASPAGHLLCRRPGLQGPPSRAHRRRLRLRAQAHARSGDALEQR